MTRKRKVTKDTSTSSKSDKKETTKRNSDSVEKVYDVLNCLLNLEADLHSMYQVVDDEDTSPKMLFKTYARVSDQLVAYHSRSSKLRSKVYKQAFLEIHERVKSDLDRIIRDVADSDD
jgi:hypothetical protein